MAANGVVCLKSNVTFQVSIANMRSQAQELVKNQKVVAVMTHPRRIIPTKLNADTILCAAAKESSKNVSQQSDSRSKVKKPLWPTLT